IMGSVLRDPTVPANFFDTVVQSSPAFNKFILAIRTAFALFGPPGVAAGELATQAIKRWIRSRDMQIIWGTTDMLPWLFVQDEWCKRLLQGDCQKSAGSVRPDGIERILKSYDIFLTQLKVVADVLEFAYDWRLSNDENARLLEEAI